MEPERGFMFSNGSFSSAELFITTKYKRKQREILEGIKMPLRFQFESQKEVKVSGGKVNETVLWPT